MSTSRYSVRRTTNGLSDIASWALARTVPNRRATGARREVAGRDTSPRAGRHDASLDGTSGLVPRLHDQ
jgi:hypothetical protein